VVAAAQRRCESVPCQIQHAQLAVGEQDFRYRHRRLWRFRTFWSFRTYAKMISLTAEIAEDAEYPALLATHKISAISACSAVNFSTFA
jgi:hypothetical protein